MREQLVDTLSEAIWEQIETILDFVEPDPIAEVMLFAYFPPLRLSSLFGTTFIQEGKPINLVCLGSSFALIDDTTSDDREFYCYVVIRERASGGLSYSYCFPYDDWDGTIRIDVREVVLDNKAARNEILKTERLVAEYALRWMDGSEENS